MEAVSLDNIPAKLISRLLIEGKFHCFVILIADFIAVSTVYLIVNDRDDNDMYSIIC